MEPKDKKIYYFRARFLKNKGKTLQDLLSASLSQLANVEQRREDVYLNSSFFNYIDNPDTHKKCEVGELAGYEVGAQQTELEISNLKKKALPKKSVSADKGHEFSDKSLYYLVSNNDVVLLQSNDAKYRSFERHLNWLLEKSGALAPEDRVELSPAPSAKLKNSFSGQDIRSIEIKSYASSRNPADKHVLLGGDILDFLLPKLGIKKAADSNLRVELVVKESRRDLSSDDYSTLEKLATIAKNLDEENSKIKLSSGAEINGSDLRLSTTVSIQYGKSGLPAVNDLHTAMHKWLQSLLTSGTIKP